MVLYSWVAILLFMADLDLNRLVTMAFIMKTEKKWGDEGFMVCILTPGALDGVTGTTSYYGG